jgi:outer membrane protein OmpA-like peptidoglycan-associated protein
LYEETQSIQRRLAEAAYAENRTSARHRRGRKAGKIWAAIVVAIGLLAVAGVAISQLSPSDAAPDRTKAAASAKATPTASPTTLPTLPSASPTVPRPSPPPPSRPKVARLSSTLLFAGDSAVLKPGAQASIAKVGEEIGRYGSGHIVVTGYAADPRPGEPDSIRLSLARAQAVAVVLRQILAGTAITVTPRGLGGANPVKANTSEANRAQNRRVEVSFAGS